MGTIRRESISLDQLKMTIGSASTASDWILVDQAMIDDFAHVTKDFAFIHTDPERARQTRFKGTIAHGLLTLSLLPRMMESATPLVDGLRMGVNYGFDRVRFITPVPVDHRVRAHVALVDLPEVKPSFYHFTYDISVEIEAKDRPALIARWILGRWMEH